MNIIIPDMLQNALTGEHDRRRGGRGCGPEGQGPDAAASRPTLANGPAGCADGAAGAVSKEQGRATVTTVTGQAEALRKSEPARPALLRRVWEHRADYPYVLPAIVVMLIVIAYPVYYTIDLSFFRTPPGLQLRDKIFVGLDNYAAILTSDVFWTVTWNTRDLDACVDVLLVRAGLCRRAGAAPRIHRPRRAARDPASFRG